MHYGVGYNAVEPVLWSPLYAKYRLHHVPCNPRVCGFPRVKDKGEKRANEWAHTTLFHGVTDLYYTKTVPY